MATTTTKKPTGSKTKTAAAKTTAKKTTKKSVPAKSVRKPAVVKSAAPKRAPRGVAVTLDKLRGLNMFAAGLFVLLAVLAGVFMANDAFQLSIGHLAKDELASTSKTVLAPAVQFVFDIQLRWVVVATLVFSAVLPVLYLTKLKTRYEAYLSSTRMLPFRWIGLGITWALMVETVALLSGVNDLMVLKLMGGLMLVAGLVWLVAERQNNVTDQPVRSAFYTGIFSGVLPMLLIAVYAIATVVYGSVRSPWYVYALYAVLVGGFTFVTLNQRNQYLKKGSAQDSLAVERNYLTADILAKATFAVVLIVGFLR